MKRDVYVWTALAFLVLGLGLTDRAFAAWRNDGSNFRMANGEYRQPEKGAEKPSFFEHKAVLTTMALVGLGMLSTSIALFGLNAESVPPHSEMHPQ